MAREYGPYGIHVAQVVIDGGIAGDRLLERNLRPLEKQGEHASRHRRNRRSSMADPPLAAFRWTHEIDLRPLKETL
jgi:hypothetical protein